MLGIFKEQKPKSSIYWIQAELAWKETAATPHLPLPPLCWPAQDLHSNPERASSLGEAVRRVAKTVHKLQCLKLIAQYVRGPGVLQYVLVSCMFRSTDERHAISSKKDKTSPVSSRRQLLQLKPCFSFGHGLQIMLSDAIWWIHRGWVNNTKLISLRTKGTWLAFTFPWR